ncbi:MAG: hypothetical protein NC402_00230 [Prevotella sp.]|nr:hypothetical protein [Prevotella sp.]MCM1074436.1 hypothetical protein [Ruminococcus sp.]
MKLLKYSLSLAGLFFISAIIPGIICVLSGLNGVWVSSGISLAIVCLLKGKIAKKIFGPNTTHYSSPDIACFLIAISLISGGIKAYTYYLNKESIESFGFTRESTREQVFNQLFVPLLIASLLLSIVLGIATYIRGTQKKHQVQTIESNEDVMSSHFKQQKKDYENHRDELKSKNNLDRENTFGDDISTNPINESDESENVKNSDTSTSPTTKNYKKYIWPALAIIIVIALVVFGIFKLCTSCDSADEYQDDDIKEYIDNSIGEYLYVDSYGNIHVDKNCSGIPSISVNRIEYEKVSNEDLQNCCHICVNDKIYKKLKETYKNKVIEQRLSNIYDVLTLYNISNLPSNRLDFGAWIEADQDNLQYLYKILSLMRVSEIGSDITTFKSWLYSDDQSQIEISTSLRRLYETCERENIHVDDFNEFIKNIQYNESDMQWIYNKLVELNYDVEPYQQYHDVVTALVPYETID